jgi:hypothetical protein
MLSIKNGMKKSIKNGMKKCEYGLLLHEGPFVKILLK